MGFSAEKKRVPIRRFISLTAPLGPLIIAFPLTGFVSICTLESRADSLTVSKVDGLERGNKFPSR